jgi:hypothetical protein
MDAGAFGNRLGLDAAYQFARGEEVTSSTGLKVKLSRPLDFLVIADHSDNMGFFLTCSQAKPSFSRIRRVRIGTTALWPARVSV